MQQHQRDQHNLAAVVPFGDLAAQIRHQMGQWPVIQNAISGPWTRRRHIERGTKKRQH